MWHFFFNAFINAIQKVLNTGKESFSLKRPTNLQVSVFLFKLYCTFSYQSDYGICIWTSSFKNKNKYLPPIHKQLQDRNSACWHNLNVFLYILSLHAWLSAKAITAVHSVSPQLFLSLNLWGWEKEVGLRSLLLIRKTDFVCASNCWRRHNAVEIPSESEWPMAGHGQ